jgi:small subunit ribosomal protein S17e
MISNRIISVEIEESFMGIKPSYIKNLGTQLLAEQRDYFSTSFEENKQQLGKSSVIGSKRVRNRVAGYITRKINSKKRS